MIPCTPLMLLLDVGLGTSPGGLIPSGSLGQWEYGNTTVAGWSGPAWGTRLGAPYFNDTAEHLEIPIPDLTGTNRPIVLIEHLVQLGAGDIARVEIDVGDGFEPASPVFGYPQGGSAFTGQMAGFQSMGIDMSTKRDARVRLSLYADAAGQGPGWFVRDVRLVDGDPLAPRISALSGPGDTQDLDGPYLVSAVIDEDVMVTDAAVHWVAGAQSGTVALIPAGPVWSAALPAVPPGTTITWSAIAEDCEQAAEEQGEPFRVFLAAPTDLAGPDQPRNVARTTTLTWSPPDSPHPVLGYEVFDRIGHTVSVASGTSADVPLQPGGQAFQVRAAYDAGFGDFSEILELDIEVPTLTAVEPASAWPGDRVYVSFEGQSLYLLDGLSAVNLGEGVQVESLAVQDVNRAVAVVRIDPEATPGPRAVQVSGAQGAFAFPDRFVVDDAAGAPRVLDVQPEGVVQGASATFVVRVNREVTGPLVVTPDDEMLYGGDAVIDGETVTLTLTALGRSRPGTHTVVIDDGERLWSVPVEIEEYRFSAGRTCASGGAAPWVAQAWWVGLLALSVARRRSASARDDRRVADRGARGTPRTRTPPPPTA